MTTMFQIPSITFIKEQYNKEANEIILNLNDFRWLDEEIESFRSSHRRLLPQLNLTSPTGAMANFAYPRLEGYEIVFEGKNCNVRLTYK